MSKERRRSIRTEQIKLRELNFSIDGTAGTPSASGPDQFGIASVTDLGAGNYTIIFNKPAANSLDAFVSGHACLTAGAKLQVTAVAYDRVTVLCTDIADAPLDCDFNLSVKLHDARYSV